MKKSFAVFVFLMFSVGRIAADELDSMFVACPLPELSMLSPASRMDMIDLYNYRMEAKGENNYGGYSELVERTPRSLRVRLSGVAMWEMTRFVRATDTMYLCLYTLQRPAPQSRMGVYGKAWQPADVDSLPKVVFEDFVVETPLTGNDSVALSDARSRLEPIRTELRRVHGDGISPTVEVVLTTTPLSIEQRERVTPLLRALRFRLNGRAWIRERVAAH